MIIDCIADMHGHYPQLEGGDLLIVAGDLTSMDTHEQMLEFLHWTMRQKYRTVVFIAGNHDNCLMGNPSMHRGPTEDIGRPDVAYLRDDGIEFEDLKIWGSPWTKRFPGMNPQAMAFTVDTEEELAEKWALIPGNTNILITHCPSFGNYDWIKYWHGGIGESVGSVSLWMKMLSMLPNLKLHVTGHIHEAYGNCIHANGICLVNASYVNERYEPVNKPVRVVL